MANKCILQLLLITAVVLYEVGSFSILFWQGLDETTGAGDQNNSVLVIISFSCAVFVCAPMLVDLVFDAACSMTSDSLFVERACILFGSVYPGLAFLGMKLWNVSDSLISKLLPSLMLSQKVWVVVPIAIVAISSKSRIFTPWRIGSIATAWLISQLLTPYIGLPAVGEICYWAQIALYACSIPPLALCLLFYGRFLFANWRHLPRQEAIVAVFCSFIFIFGAIFVAQKETASSTKALAYRNFGMSLFTIACTGIPGRLGRTNFIESVKELATKQAFVRYVSHELRTPMNVAIMGMNILEEKLGLASPLDKETKVVFDQVKQAHDTTVEILNDILTYDKLSSNLMTLEKTAQNVIEYIVECLQIFQLQAQSVHVLLTLPNEKNCDALIGRTITVDEHKFSQVLRNLVSNALKFTPPGGSVDVQVEVCDSPSIPAESELALKLSSAASATASGSSSRSPVEPSKITTEYPTEWLRISVKDSGAGIAKKNLSRLFKEIVQFDANKLQHGKGSGIGLFITKGIVDLHGGRIAVYSDGEGKGCTFVVEVPLDSDAREPQQGWAAGNDGKSWKVVRQLTRVLTWKTSSKIGPYFDTYLSAKTTTASRRDVQLREEERNSGESIQKDIEMGLTNESADKLSALSPIADSPSRYDVISVHSSSQNDHYESLQTETFSFKTPLGKPKAVSSPISIDHFALHSPSDSAASMSARRELEGVRILVVDDSSVNLKMTILFCSRMGAICNEAVDGHFAVDMVKNSLESTSSAHYDAVIMDNLMPTMCGPEACRNMRKLGFSGPIFGLTGHALSEDITSYLQEGATQVFVKPLDKRVFVATIRNLRADGKIHF